MSISFRGDKSYTLIDTGWDSETAFNSLNRQLAEIGVGFQDISQIIITHAHFDHYGLAGKIKQLSNAKIYMHQRDQEIFRTRYAVTEEFLHQAGQWFRINGVPAAMLGTVHMPIRWFSGNLSRHNPIFSSMVMRQLPAASSI